MCMLYKASFICFLLLKKSYKKIKQGGERNE
ncbi:hypothetical protein BCD_1773 (plasmid) [Borrelia crocidurae DOU]|uniref:Uncharacterized protein n=1 Tax=Borrelia crocidurae DOU TaxID=1293575 RepID=W5SL08_9SPIR|nr:hypothetical protein BCD_1773 [Borrelia crocidurae DOU]